MATTTAQIYDSVQSHYGSCARDTPISTQGGHSQRVAQAFGYAAEDLANVPEGANLGLSCGNPIALAGLKSVGARSYVYCANRALRHMSTARLSFTLLIRFNCGG